MSGEGMSDGLNCRPWSMIRTSNVSVPPRDGDARWCWPGSKLYACLMMLVQASSMARAILLTSSSAKPNSPRRGRDEVAHLDEAFGPAFDCQVSVVARSVPVPSSGNWSPGCIEEPADGLRLVGEDVVEQGETEEVEHVVDFRGEVAELDVPLVFPDVFDECHEDPQPGAADIREVPAVHDDPVAPSFSRVWKASPASAPYGHRGTPSARGR